MTTLSQRWEVACTTETSSSSHSARRLGGEGISRRDGGGDVVLVECSPVHFFGFLDDFLTIAVGGCAFLLGLLRIGRLVFLRFVVLVGGFDAHLTIHAGHAEAEVRVIDHVDGELDGLGAEVD